MADAVIQAYKHPLAWLYGLLVLGAGIGQFVDPRMLVDSAEYLDAVHYWFQFDTIKLDPFSGDRWMDVTRRTPGYPFLLYIVGTKGVLLVQVLAAMLSPVFIHAALRNSLQFKYGPALFWTFWISWPLQFYYAALPMPEIIVQCLLSIWIWTWANNRIRYSALIIALLILFKPVFIVLLLPQWWAFGMDMAAKMRKTGFSSALKIDLTFKFYTRTLFRLLPIFTILALVRINHQRWNTPHISSVGTTNFYEYNRAMTLEQVYGKTYTDSVYAQESKWLNAMSNFDPKKGDWISARTSETLKAHMGTYVFLHVKGMLQMFVDPGRYDAMVFLKWPVYSGFLGIRVSQQPASRPLYEWVYMIVFAIVNVVKLGLIVTALGFLLLYKKTIDVTTQVALLTLVLVAIATGPVGTARYVLPLYPLIVWMVVKNIPRKIN